MYTGSFRGEVAVADAGCQPGWPDCPSACSTLAGSPSVADGGARVIVASRSNQTIYRMQMDSAGGSLRGRLHVRPAHPAARPVRHLRRLQRPVRRQPRAYAFVSQLRSANNIGYLNRMNLLDESEVIALVLGDNATYTSIFDAVHDLVFVSSSVSASAQFRWFNPLVTLTDIQGFAVPDYSGPFFSNLVPGAVARDMALSSDGSLLYVNVQLRLRRQTWRTRASSSRRAAPSPSSTCTPCTFGLAAHGAPTASPAPARGRPILGACPSRAGKPDLFAITCDLEGALAIYDSDARAVVRYIGQDPVTGLPALGAGFPSDWRRSPSTPPAPPSSRPGSPTSQRRAYRGATASGFNGGSSSTTG